MHVTSQVTSLHRAALLHERASRALPSDTATTKGNQGQRLRRAEVVVVLPDAVVVGLAPREERAQTAGQGVSLATGALVAALDLGHERVLAVGDVVDLALLDDGGAAEGLGELLAQLGRVLLRWVDALDLGQAAELDHVGGQDAVFVALDEVWAGLRQVQTVGVEDEGNALFAGFCDDAGAGFLHGLVAAETGADDYAVQTVEHCDDFVRDGVDGILLVDVLGLAHVWVHHENWVVGLDDGGGLWLTDDVGHVATETGRGH